MPIIITWRLRNPIHTGSTELNGVGGQPTVYQHPQDMGGTPMASSFSGWNYNQADYTNNNIVQDRLLFTNFGRNSYSKYRQYHQLAQQWGGGVPEPWNGQQNAAQVFRFPLAANLQPSGNALYEAFASVNPAAPNPTTVTITAVGWCLVLSITTVPRGIGGGRSVDCASKIFNGPNIVDETLVTGRVQRPFQFKYGRVSSTYNIIIPPGGETKIGEVTAGLAYTIAGGTNTFLTVSSLRFLFGGETGVPGEDY